VKVLSAAVVTCSRKLVFLKVDCLLREADLRFDGLVVFFYLSDAPDNTVYSDYQWNELKKSGLRPRRALSGDGARTPKLA
jgi:hypothetical protein